MFSFKFDIYDAIVYNDMIGRVEDRALDGEDREMYLIRLANHHYHWVEVKDLEVYIG